MYVRMYVCMYVRMYVSTYVRMYVGMYVRTYVCMCMYVRTYVCMYACFYVCMCHSFTPQSALQQVYSLFQSKFSTQYDLVLPFKFTVSSLSYNVIQ
jgi:hypothetical protein